MGRKAILYSGARVKTNELIADIEPMVWRTHAMGGACVSGSLFRERTVGPFGGFTKRVTGAGVGFSPESKNSEAVAFRPGD